MSAKISVVVPVYNVEKYLCECVDSVIAQSFGEWELLLIDDGSSDRSGVICDEYAAKDARIRVIHKENEGVGRARNTGLLAAAGEYVTFIDSDDWIERDMLRDLYDSITAAQADCAACGLRYFYEDGCGDQSYVPPKGAFDPQHEFDAWYCAFDENFIFSAQVAKLYRTAILKQGDVLQEEQFSILEDGMFVTDALLQCRRVSCCDTAPYHYRQTANMSLIKKYNTNAADALLRYWEKMQPLATWLNTENQRRLHQKFQRYYVQFLLQIYTRSALSGKEKYRELTKFDARRFPFLKKVVCKGKKERLILSLMRIHAWRLAHGILSVKFG